MVRECSWSANTHPVSYRIEMTNGEFVEHQRPLSILDFISDDGVLILERIRAKTNRTGRRLPG
jgi:hypothetical protein